MQKDRVEDTVLDDSVKRRKLDPSVQSEKQDGEVIREEDGFTFVRKQRKSDITEDLDLSSSKTPKIYRKLIPPSYPSSKSNRSIVRGIDEDLSVDQKVLELFIKTIEVENKAVLKTFRDRFQFVGDGINEVSSTMMEKLPSCSIAEKYAKSIASRKEMAEKREKTMHETLIKQNKILDGILKRQKKEMKLWDQVDIPKDIIKENEKGFLLENMAPPKQEFSDLKSAVSSINTQIDLYSSSGIRFFSQYGKKLKHQTKRLSSLRKESLKLTARK